MGDAEFFARHISANPMQYINSLEKIQSIYDMLDSERYYGGLGFEN